MKDRIYLDPDTWTAPELPTEEEAIEAMLYAECDPESAADLMRIAGEYMLSGELPPGLLAAKIGFALVSAADTLDPKKRLSVLGEELHLKTRGRRPAVLWFDVAEWIDKEKTIAEESGKPLAMEVLLEMAAAEFRISERTAQTHWSKYLNELDLEAKIGSAPKGGFMGTVTRKKTYIKPAKR